LVAADDATDGVCRGSLRATVRAISLAAVPG
jgi:hypothetical protein